MAKKLTLWEAAEIVGVSTGAPRQQGRPRKLLQREAQYPPVCVKALAVSLPSEAWRQVTWRPGSETETAFAFCRFARASCASGLLASGHRIPKNGY
jgi:hypothetical protein